MIFYAPDDFGIVPVLNTLIPIAVVFLSIWLWRLLRRPISLVFVPGAVFWFLAYVDFLILTLRGGDPSSLHVSFRYVLSLTGIAIVAFMASEIIAINEHKKLNGK